MTSSWLPVWLAVVWVVAFVAVAVVHLRHIVAVGGPHRIWHWAHVLMALGMIVMYLPVPAMAVPWRAGAVVSAVLAVAVMVMLGVWRSRARRGDPVWLLTVVDFGWMAYMFWAMVQNMGWLSGIGVAWFVVEGVGWASGVLGRVLERQGVGERQVAAVGALGLPLAPASDVTDGGSRDWSVRISLAVMALGMAYMFLTLTSGMPGMPGMSNMHGNSDVPGMPGGGGAMPAPPPSAAPD